MKMNLISIFVCLLPLVTMLASNKQILRSRSFRNFVADNSADRSSENVDVNLFSRQLMVYGFSAQDCLAKSSIYINSNGPLAAEIFKNLVLSGIGRIVLKMTEKTPPAFIGKLGFKRFAAEINGNVKVDEVSEDPITFADFAVVVCVGGKFTDAASLNAKARDAGAKFVSCRTVGVGGCLFSDFLSDHVAEIPSPSIAVPVLTGTVLGESKEEWHLQPLWNEKLRELSEGDVVALSWPCNTTDVTTRSFDSLVGCVDSINLDASNCSVTFVPTQSNLSSIQAASLNQALGSGVVLLRQLPRRLLCSHQSLEDQLRNPTFSPLNYCNSDKANDLESKSVFAAFKALDSSYRTGVNNYGRSSRPIFKRFQREFDAALHDLIGKGSSLSDAQTARVHRIRDAVYHCVGVRCPATNTVLGAMAAQEVIKATTRQFPPMASQWWGFEAFDTLPDTLSSVTFGEKCQSASGTDKLALETEVAEELARLKVLVVGSGAIGCDLLKMLAQFGVGSSGRPKDHSDGNAQPLIRKKEQSLWDEFAEVGGVVVTDMDVIEKSNLNRQYLFRFKDIGKPKSRVAAAAIRRKFPFLKIRPLVQKVGPSFQEDASKQPDQFSSAFWKNCDVVLTALDNVEARRFVDSKCQRFGKPLIDSGTTGLKASTQVVYPHVTETYSSSTDVEKDEIPVCTMKSFPYLTEHCCAWAKVAFQSVASEDVQLVRRLLQFETKKPDLNEWLSTLSEEEKNDLQEALLLLRGSDKANATFQKALLGWAIQKYNKWFDVEPCRLLESHPADSVDEDGVKFWGGTRRLPRAHKFDRSDRLARICVVNLAAQRWRLLFDRHANHGDLVARFNDEMDSPSFVAQEAETISAADWVFLLEESVRLKTLDRLSEEDFDKDDVLKGHLDLVASLSNLRARTFDLPEMERLDVLRIAGNVIPALPTTTSLVAGLVALELVKLASERVRQRRQAGRIMGNFHNDDCYADELPVIPVGKKAWSRSSVANRLARQLMKSASNCFSALLRVAPSLFCSKRTNADHERDHLLRRFRNHFIDLSRPTFSYAEPSPVAVNAGPEGCKFTDWDNIEITAPFNQFSIGELLQQLKRKLQLKAAYQVNSVLLNDTLLYPILEEDNFEFRPEMTFNQLLAIAQESTVDAWLPPARAKDEIELVVEISDCQGNVYTLPRIMMRNDNSKSGLMLWFWG